MGSLNSDGTLKLQTANKQSIRHQGDFLTRQSSDDKVLATNAEVIANSGIIRTQFDSRGVIWQAGGTVATSGLPMSARDADNSVERQKFTHNSQADGNLQQHVTRKNTGIHVSISDRQAIVNPIVASGSGLIGGDALGPMQTINERKIFFIANDRASDGQVPVAASGWNIYDVNGNAVSATGVTNTTYQANKGLLGFPE